MIRLIFAVLLLTSQVSFADISIIDVRRNIPLSNDEPAYTDYYINGGESDGLKKNLVVTVYRQLHIRDFSGAQSYGEIPVQVGQLRILAVFGKISVAREYKLLSRDEHPMLEQIGIMSGDRITLEGSFIDKKPLRKPQAVKPSVTTSATPTPTSTPASTAALATTPATAPAPLTSAPITPGVSAPPTHVPAVTTPTPAPPTALNPENSIPEALLEAPVNNSPAPTVMAPTATRLQ